MQLSPHLDRLNRHISQMLSNKTVVEPSLVNEVSVIAQSSRKEPSSSCSSMTATETQTFAAPQQFFSPIIKKQNSQREPLSQEQALERQRLPESKEIAERDNRLN